MPKEHPGNEPGWKHSNGGVAKQCTAKSKRSQQRCRAVAMLGQNVCRMHGGSIPKARANGRERHAVELAEAKAEAMLEKRGITPTANPVDVLYELLDEIVAWKDIATERRDEIAEFSYRSDGNTEQLRAEITVWERAVDRAVKAATDIQKLGLAEQRIQINALQAQQVGERVQSALRELFARMRGGLTTEDAEREMPALLRKHLLGE